MKILVKGFGDLENAVINTLKDQFSVKDCSLVNASQAYALLSYGDHRIGAAFHLDIENDSLYLIGNTEENLSKADMKKLNMMPENLLEQLTDGPGANPQWRQQNFKYLAEHKDHLFRGAIMSSSNPPMVYDHGSLENFIVTHPASKSAFELDGFSVEVPQFLRGFYKVSAVPTIDSSHMREGVNSINNATQILLTNLSIKYSSIELAARYLDLPPTPPIVVISDAKTMMPVAMSKEEQSFQAIESWGKQHNKALGINKRFIINNSENVKSFINEDSVNSIKDSLKSKNKLQEYRTPAS